MAQDVLGSFLGNPEFIEAFDELVELRRDVRRFGRDAVAEEMIEGIISAVRFAPSVGLSEPTRLVRLESQHVREAVRLNFETANAQALGGYEGEAALRYSGLKLAGLAEAPVQFAVFCDAATDKGKGLGCRTLPEAKTYSSACAIMLIWLSAAARGLGLGWVTIFEGEALRAALGVEETWTFMGCICIGWPEEQHLDPELERAGWEARYRGGVQVITR